MVVKQTAQTERPKMSISFVLFSLARYVLLLLKQKGQMLNTGKDPRHASISLPVQFRRLLTVFCCHEDWICYLRDV